MSQRRIIVWIALSCCLGAGCGDDDATPRATPTAAGAATATSTSAAPATSTVTRTVAVSATATATPPATASASSTPTVSASPTTTRDATAPAITFFGIARSDDLPLAAAGTDAEGRPIFVRVQGQGMAVVLEARRGTRRIIRTAYDPDGGMRGAEFLVSRPLGDGNAAVCDIAPPQVGGVPGFDPPLFSSDPAVQLAIDDFGCRVNDGTGAPQGRVGADACTRTEPTFDYAFVASTSEVQFCVPIALSWSFPVGDTIVAARVRDEAGGVSEPSEIVVRVREQEPFTCDEGLGEATVPIARPASRLISSARPGADASADPWSAAALRVCAGPEIVDGIHGLNLRADVVLGVSVAAGGTLCTRILASGSSGNIDCNGGSAADVRSLQDEDGITRVAVFDELGVDAGTGAAVIRAPMSVVELPPGSTPDDCAGADYPAPFRGVLTTAMGTAQVVTRAGTVLAEASASGRNFDCTRWREDAGGALALPFPLVNGSAGDLAQVLLLSP